MPKRSLLLTVAIASILSAAGSAFAEEVAPPDTSEWSCSKCPFDRGYRSTVELGGAYVDDDAAKFGDYTGLDEKGGYVIADAEGRSASESGFVVDYELTDLGLDSREVRVGGEQQGQYEFELFYDAIPHRIWDTTETPFHGVGSRNLTLPDGWVDAGSTGGMTALDASLRDADVGFDRDRYGATGRFWLGDAFEFAVGYQRDDRDGVRTQFGSLGSVSTELLRPVDDTTDRLDATVRYQGANWFLEGGYSGSIYENSAAHLRWDNPFNPIVPGADVGQMALTPDNDYHELALSAGWYGLPWNTTVAVSAATGRGTQDATFLPYTINPQIATDALPMANLDGEVTVTRADLTVSSRPIDRLRLRATAAWDERENDSQQATFTSIIHTDAFPVDDDRINPVYGFERLRLYGSADFEVYHDLSVGVGGEYRETDRTGTDQEVRSEEQLDGWGQVQYRPTGYLGIVLKGGAKERDPDRYDTEVAEAYGQNPLMRKYNMAYLYRSYGEALASVSFGSLPLTLGASAFYGDDSYNLSVLGKVSGLDRRYAFDLTWAMDDKYSAWVSAGEEKIDARTQGSSTFNDVVDWRSKVEDDFVTYGAGLRAQITDAIRLDLSYTFGAGDSDTTIFGVSEGKFPTVESQLSSFRADLAWAVNEQVDLAFTWLRETFESDDWAISGIGPATMPTILSLGADPYDYDVNYVSASLRYYFGNRKLALPAEGE
jgi:MtrB/PioB family decaheme-associated outer membrane protein